MSTHSHFTNSPSDQESSLTRRHTGVLSKTFNNNNNNNNNNTV